MMYRSLHLNLTWARLSGVSLAAVLLLAACSRGGESAGQAPAATGPAATAPAITFGSTTVTLAGKPFTLEVAQNDAQHERGLMLRKLMPADHGMLFVFSEPDTYAFGMHNTDIPLDIIFLDPSGKIVDIFQGKPHDDTLLQTRSPALFVIELNAGTAKALGLKVGSTIHLPEKYLKPTGGPNDK